jgi:hypothetical protein
MSIFISIGPACNVKYQIDENQGNKETLFFDWLMVDMLSVITIFNNYDQFDCIINPNTIIKDISNAIIGNNSRILFSSLPNCISIHDLPIEYSQIELEEFVSKYKRRFERIIDYIKSNELIYFLRYSDITDDHIDQFICSIKKINPNCNFKLVCIFIHENNSESIVSSDYFIKFNIKKPEFFDSSDWTTTYIDWKKIFAEIKNLV